MDVEIDVGLYPEDALALIQHHAVLGRERDDRLEAT
jgi:hypothetical protein